MIGFVGAMASSLAIFVVFLTIIMVQSVNIILNKRSSIIEYESNQKISTPERVKITIDATKSFVITGQDIRNLLEVQKENPDANFALYCTYGANLNLEVSERVSVFNYIRMQQAGVYINLFPPIQINKDNKCFIKDVNTAANDYPIEQRSKLNILTPQQQKANSSKRENNKPIVPQTTN